MATFEIDVGGTTYEIDAPDEATATRVAKEYHLTEGAMDRSIDRMKPPGQKGEESFMDRLDGTMRSVARGAPVIGGFADEIAAGGDALMSFPFEWINENVTGFEPRDADWRNAMRTDMSLRDRYAMGLRKESAKDEEWDTEHPYMSTAGKLAGAAAGGAALVNMVPGAFHAATLPGQMAKGGLMGGTIAGAHGFGEAEGDFEERGKHALKSGAKGVALGAMFPLLFRGGEKLYEAGKNKLGEMTGLFGTPSRVEREVVDLFRGDGVTDDALRGLREPIPAHALSDDAAALGEQIARTPGDASKAMVRAAQVHKGALQPHAEQGADQVTHRALDNSDRIINAGQTSSQKIAEEVIKRLGGARTVAAVPGVPRAAANITGLFGKGGGDWLAEIGVAVGNLMRQGKLDKNLLEAGRMIMGSGPEMAEVFTRVAASQAQSYAQAQAITSVLRSLTPGAISYSTGGKF